MQDADLKQGRWAGVREGDLGCNPPLACVDEWWCP